MKRFFLLLVVLIIVACLQGCMGTMTKPSKDLVVVEQTDTIYGKSDDNRHEFASFTIDVPVNGPQVLVDSVMVLLNNELYEACESNAHFDEDTVSFSKETMYSDDGETLLSQYMEKYKSEIQDSLWRTFGLILKMEAQTEKYIIYGLEFFYCGAGCSSEKYYYTFDKRDGHQVKEIISHENIVRFFKDYPEYAKQDDFAWEFRPEQDYFESFYGLLNDHFSLVIIGWYNHFFTIDIPYSQIFSYLSQEAQSLVEQTGEEETMLPAYLPERSEDGEVWMEVDTVNHVLLGYIRAAGGAIGVCYVGGVDENGEYADTRTPEQKASLWYLLKELKQTYPKAKIVGHRDFPKVAKACPCFDVQTEYADLNK